MRCTFKKLSLISFSTMMLWSCASRTAVRASMILDLNFQLREELDLNGNPCERLFENASQLKMNSDRSFSLVLRDKGGSEHSFVGSYFLPISKNAPSSEPGYVEIDGIKHGCSFEDTYWINLHFSVTGFREDERIFRFVKWGNR